MGKSQSEWINSGGNKIHHTCVILDNVVLGTGNVIYPYTVIGLPGFIRDGESSTGRVVIGDNNWLGAHVSIMVGMSGITEVGNNNMIMNYSNIGHDVVVGDHNEIGVRAILAGYCKIGDSNKIKIDCSIRNRATLGDGNIIGMGSVLTKTFDVNKMLIYGAPARVIRKC